MTESSLLSLTALELGAAIARREVSVLEATQACLAQIARMEPKINAFITVTADAARAQAQNVQARIDAGTLTHPLAGVPMAIKDNIAVRGVPTTCASKMLKNYTPVYDATVTARLFAAGAVCLGKLNLDEFAMGSSTESSHFGVTRNPWNENHVSGGSSGGSAAAVCAREVFYALGTDTGGSIRQPAHFCGVMGIKPTYGSVSRHGLHAYASSLDQIGPLCRDARDGAAILSLLMGKDEHDATSVSCSPPALPQGTRLDTLRVGLPTAYFESPLDEDIRKAVLSCADTLRALGATVAEASLPHLPFAVPTYFVLANAEASANLARYDGIRYGFRPKDFDGTDDLYCAARSEGFGAEVKRRLLLGTYVLSGAQYDAYFEKARRARTCIARDFDAAFAQFDVLLTPTSPATAYPIGRKVADASDAYSGDIFTVSANLAGLPALSFPCGMSRDGLPIGAQLIAPAFGEETLLRVAHAYEQSRKHSAPCPKGVLPHDDL